LHNKSETSWLGSIKSIAESITGTSKAQSSSSPTDADGYSTNPAGIQTSFTHEKHDHKRPTLAQELHSQSIVKDEPQDDYPQTRKGLQESFGKEHIVKIGKSALELDLEGQARLVEAVNRGTQSQVDDFYSTKAIGLQRSLHKERETSGQIKSLEHELHLMNKPQNMSSHVNQYYETGYSEDPTGLQDSYKNEYNTSGVSLEDEFRGIRGQHVDQGVYDTDPYAHSSTGLQSSFEKERQGLGLSLEEEFRVSRGHSHDHAVYDSDPYTNSTTGLQSSFAKEQQSTSTDLEDEFRNVRGQTRSYGVFDQDPYTNKTTGLQETFLNETKSGSSLEQEFSFARSDTQVHGTYDSDPYTSSTTGLQSSYTKEQHAVNSGQGQSLEEEVKIKKHIDPQHDTTYSNAATGLQASYNKEQRDVSAGLSTSLEEQMRTSPLMNAINNVSFAR